MGGSVIIWNSLQVHGFERISLLFFVFSELVMCTYARAHFFPCGFFFLFGNEKIVIEVPRGLP